VLREGLGGPHVFNLGHGIFREAEPDQVARLVDLVQGFASRGAAARAPSGRERQGRAEHERTRLGRAGHRAASARRRAHAPGPRRAGARVRGDRRRRHFAEHTWERPEGGGGTARVIEDGRRVRARRRERLRRARGTRPAQPRGHPPRHRGTALLRDRDLAGAAPPNPYAPAFHANFRYFECGDGERPRVWWFGGGLDLTPAYPTDADVRHFHHTLAAWCERFEQADYPAWKATCDAYFTVRHRGEMRGVGGVFFDELRPPAPLRTGATRAAFEADLACVSAGHRHDPARLRAADRAPPRRPFGERERRWQGLRRGRYVEFNLVYDRGTLFGLQTGGNIEAILMSLPPIAHWAFGHRPEPGSREEAALALLPAAGVGPRPSPSTRRPHDEGGREPMSHGGRPVPPVRRPADRPAS
jgi:coproporphyrinogen III oxidase